MPVGPEDFYQLAKQIERIRDVLANEKDNILKIYSMNDLNDARITSYNKIINVLNSVQLSLVFVTKHLLNQQWWDYLSPETIPTDDKILYADNFVNFIKLGFIQGLYMSIESSFRLFLRALDPIACNQGMAEFKSIYECLFKTKLKCIPIDGILLLDFLRLVRNTIHNNGVYYHKNGDNVSITWEGDKFDFQQGIPVDFVTWELLIRMTDALHNLLFIVVTDSNLKAISTKIIDPFSS